MKFTKMHGIGNDYVYVNCFEETLQNPSAVAKFVSDRHFGIGSDGLILICPSKVADVRMVMYNADGSEGSMCGNGIRCVAKYAYDRGLVKDTTLRVETKSGIKELKVSLSSEGKVETVRVNMGAPILAPAEIPVASDEAQVVDAPFALEGEEYRMTCVSMGNPHAVFFVENTAAFPVEEVGAKVEVHPLFPDRVNVEFVQILNENEVNMRVWERGAGETWACGTGACATAVACVLNGFTKEEVLVHLLGGDLHIVYDRAANTVWMTGAATTVFDGEIDLSAIDR